MASLISGLGILFFAFYAAEHLVFHLGQGIRSIDFVVGASVTGIFVVSLVYGGFWLDRSELSPKRYPRIVNWTVSGLVVFLAINVPMLSLWGSGDLAFQVGWGRWAANVGAASGLLIGCIEARTIQRELAAERATMRAESAESQRQWFDYLNGLLRHEVLNTTNVINGYASLLLDEDDIDDDARAYLQTIRNQSDEMTKVIQDVQVLIEATQSVANLETKDLTEILVAESNKLRATYESVEVDVSVPDDVTVLADDLLPRVFSNILRNAVEHNDSSPVRITVTAEQTAETVVVRIADNGPGIRADDRATLFERSDNTGATHGLGLYLVRTLAERYGGTVELTDADSDGSVFAVTLPVTEEATGGVAPGEMGGRASLMTTDHESTTRSSRRPR